jgi:hypothetical protein
MQEFKTDQRTVDLLERRNGRVTERVDGGARRVWVVTDILAVDVDAHLEVRDSSVGLNAGQKQRE